MMVIFHINQEEQKYALLQESLNSQELIVRFFANTQMCRDATMTERRRAELVVRNAGFVESARDERLRIKTETWSLL
jgi:hypothetical protein